MRKNSNAYWAGFFDGEGCVHIMRHKKKNYLSVQVTVTQKDPAVLFLLQKQFGGTVQLKQRKHFCHAWRINSREEIEVFLNAIMPHVLVKKKDVMIGLKMVVNIVPHQQGYFPLPKKEKERKEELLRQLVAHRRRFDGFEASVN